MDVIIIRHTTPDVPKGTCYGWSDVDVASTFAEEAEITFEELKYLLRDGAGVDAAFTSPLMRAKKLAEFCGFGNAVEDVRLKEMNMGDWEMQRFDDIKDPALREWYADYFNKPATGGESFPMLYARVAEFLTELKNQSYKRVIIFAHGGVCVCAGIYAGLFPKSEAFSHLPSYGGILQITI